MVDTLIATGSFMTLTISRSLLLFGLLVGTGVSAAIGIQNSAFDRLRVNGPVYEQIIHGKDLVADILPPPLFLVETYLLATEGAYHPELAAENLKRIALLHKDYDARKTFWATSTLGTQFKQQLAEKVQPSGDRFWNILDNDYARAVAGGDPAAIRAAVNSLKSAFEVHRAEVDALVAAANQRLSSTEKQAAEETVTQNAASYAAGLAALGLLVAGLIGLHRRAIRPLRGMRDYMSILAGGDYSKPVPYDGRGDEIGEMAAAVTVFRGNAQERIAARQRQEVERERGLSAERQQNARRAEEDATRAGVITALSAGLGRLATGDLTNRLSAPFASDYEKLRQEFNGSLQTLEDAMIEIGDAMRSVETGALSIAHGTDDLSRRTESQASSLEQAASALAEITTTVRTTTDRAREASNRMSGTRASAENSNLVVREAVDAMARIEDSSNQIRQIIGVIDEIAFQTNLLALNAGVEAARAGEAGKGFAVVAQEVRELAGRSAGASREIRQLIDTSSKQVDAGVALVHRTGQSLGDIEQQIQSVNDLIGNIVSAAGEQAHALAEVSEAVNRMDQVTQQNAAMAEETSAACGDLNRHTARLGQHLARFNVGGQRQAGRSRMAS
ncbi:methyl-accepting chemotaxis protein [Neorhizobium galegae]|uniref:methyl-accepting chemotaxis protein n=1 Tax=Neorhizobium galegae TaxID=399 RepID=UPI001FD92945|nr:methyl-accepting chemotaxis protein [Neorhizobium galegae]MBP2549427.1 methyl-accepting chemotaxis protein [Neorhizobium galegae]